MLTRKILNISSLPPTTTYQPYSNNCEEQKPLQQQYSNQQEQQHNGNNKQSNNLTKLKNFFIHFRTKSTSALSALSALHTDYTQQQQHQLKHQQQSKRHHYRHGKLIAYNNNIPIVQSTSIILNIVCIVVTLVLLASIEGVTSISGFEDNSSLAQICGRRRFRQSRVHGGSDAGFGRWPWQISLLKWNGSTFAFRCGATLLNKNWAITAAHTVKDIPHAQIRLRLGEYDLDEENEPYAYQERQVKTAILHPQCYDKCLEYDLALLRFDEPVVFQPHIVPACLPETDEDFNDQTAFVTGWGRLSVNGSYPNVLQEVAVPVMSNSRCESMFKAANYNIAIPDIFMCAGFKNGGYDACYGDSGGPIVLLRKSDKRFQLISVSAWGIGCGKPNQPGVYTRISEVRDWIIQTIQL